jgi:hypothetical protein
MRLSIWQQFSSNHSGFFIVVGVFESPDAAQTATRRIKEMLYDIDTWHRQHPQTAASHQTEPYPPEKAIAEEYDIQWPQTIDWEDWAAYKYYEDEAKFDRAQKAASREIDNAINREHSVVQIKNPSQTWMGVQPFKDLLEHFGARTAGYDMNEMDDTAMRQARFRLTCDAPDEASARKLRDNPLPYDITHQLTVTQENAHLTYKFTLTSLDFIRHLVDYLESNNCQTIGIQLEFEESA